MSIMAPLCMSCKHLNDADLSCTAFPDGIPDPIFESRADHRKPYEGDNGIVFAQKKGAELPGTVLLEILDEI